MIACWRTKTPVVARVLVTLVTYCHVINYQVESKLSYVTYIVHVCGIYSGLELALV